MLLYWLYFNLKKWTSLSQTIVHPINFNASFSVYICVQRSVYRTKSTTAPNSFNKTPYSHVFFDFFLLLHSTYIVKLNVAEFWYFFFVIMLLVRKKNYTIYEWWLIDIFPALNLITKCHSYQFVIMIKKIPIKKLSKYCQKPDFSEREKKNKNILNPAMSNEFSSNFSLNHKTYFERN